MQGQGTLVNKESFPKFNVRHYDLVGTALVYSETGQPAVCGCTILNVPFISVKGYTEKPSSLRSVTCPKTFTT